MHILAAYCVYELGEGPHADAPGPRQRKPRGVPGAVGLLGERPEARVSVARGLVERQLDANLANEVL